MRLLPAVMVALFLALALCPPLPAVTLSGLPRRFSLSADEAQYDLSQQQARAQGHALLIYDDVTLRADALDANLESGQVTAVGGVTVVQGPRRLTADRAEYNVKRQAGTLLRATAGVGPALFRGERLVVSPRQFSVYSASFTTCPLPHPDYEVRARSITLYPGDRVVARHAAIYFYGHRLLSLPTLSQNLNPDREAPGILPRAGYSRLDGPFAGLAYGFAPGGPQTTGIINVRYTTRRGLRGWLRTSYLPSWGRISLTASRKEDLNERPITSIVEPLPTTVQRVTVDRLPELALHRKTGNLMPWLTGQAWVTAGRYRELPTGVSANRLSLVADLETEPWQVSPRLGLTAGFGVRQSYYSGRDQQRLVAPRVGLRYDGGKRFSLALSYQHRSTTGSTPFLFDEIQIRREITGNLVALPHPLWRVEVGTRFDTANGELRDAEVTLFRTVHCLEYSVGWRKERSELRVGLGLAAGTLEAIQAAAAQETPAL